MVIECLLKCDSSLRRIRGGIDYITLMEETPKLSPYKLTERVTICLEPELKARLDYAKDVRRDNVAEMIRRFLRDALPASDEQQAG